MVLIKNRSLNFTILYLPSRSIRVEGKSEIEITQEEFESPMFNQRKEEFMVLDNENPQTTPVKRGKREKDIIKEAPKEREENESIDNAILNSEPI